MARQRVFSGIQPTGQAHIGNLLGALRSWVALQEGNDAFYCIVDLHALTLPWSPGQLKERTLAKAAEVIACGVDPDRAVLFVQSQVPAHAELTWVLTCITRMGELRRMVQFKEKAKGEAEVVGAGIFTYPVLQATDVLLYQANGVPVGEDQRQHVELMRDLAERFNGLFGETFTLPAAWVPEAGARIMALDDPTQKMSKSAERPGSAILMVDSPDAIARKVRAAKTDSGREVRARPDKPELTNLLTIFSLVEGTPLPVLEERFASSGYGEFKQALADLLVERLAPVRRRYAELAANPEETAEVLRAGAERAAAAAEKTMLLVRERTGLGSRPAGTAARQKAAGEADVADSLSAAPRGSL